MIIIIILLGLNGWEVGQELQLHTENDLSTKQMVKPDDTYNIPANVIPVYGENDTRNNPRTRVETVTSLQPNFETVGDPSFTPAGNLTTQLNVTVKNTGGSATVGEVPIFWETLGYELALENGEGVLKENVVDFDLNGDGDKTDSFNVTWTHNVSRPWDATVDGTYVYALDDYNESWDWSPRTYYINSEPKVFTLGSETHFLYMADNESAQFGLGATVLLKKFPSPNFELLVYSKVQVNNFTINGQPVEENLSTQYVDWTLEYIADVTACVVPNQAFDINTGEEVTFSCNITAQEPGTIGVAMVINWSPDGNTRYRWVPVIEGDVEFKTTTDGSHVPISIYGNEALATFIEDEGLNGEGTYASPYIIENLLIDASTENGIEIQNTDTYLIIRNCTIEGGSSNRKKGIILYNATNVNISNNSLKNNYYGIRLDFSCNNNFTDNIVSYNTQDGICLTFSSNNTFISNTANYNNYYGICLEFYCYKNIFTGNTANSNIHGIYLIDPGNNTLIGNFASYNTDSGIRMASSCNNTLIGNFASYNNNTGIYLVGSHNNILTGNIVSNNNGTGIYLFYSNNSILTGNIVSYNFDYGIHLISFSAYDLNTANNIIYFNDIYGNTNGQAYEDANCNDNHWDNGITGNYWGVDYINNYPSATNDGKIWNIPYEISGDGRGIDHFPLVNSITIDIDYYNPQFTNILEDFSDYEGYSELSISWIATDLYPATYTLELNGNVVVSATAWTDGSTITYNIPDGLLKGDYNVTIIVTDESGNTVQDTVIFTVISTETTTTDDTTAETTTTDDTTTTEDTADDTTTTTTPSWNVLFLLLSFIAMLPLRQRKKKS